VIYDGFLLDTASMRVPLGGQDITEYLASRLLPKLGVNCNTSAERDQANTIKEEICYVRETEKAETAGALNYKLPSGETIQIDQERYLAAEILFDPVNKIGEDIRSL
jgi:centractin